MGSFTVHRPPATRPQDPVFMAAHLAAVASMVETSFAHPSVVFHGFFNEGPSNDAAACPGYAASAQVRRRGDWDSGLLWSLLLCMRLSL